MVTIERFTQSYNILESGSLITFSDNEPVRFAVNVSEDEGVIATVNVEIIFAHDNTVPRNLSRTYNGKTNSVKLLCVNFENPLGTGTTEAIKILTYKEKAIYINFWVFQLGNTRLKRLDYTFYQEK